MAGMGCKRIAFRDVLSGLCACLNVALTVSSLISLNALFTDWLDSFGAGRARTAIVQATCLGVTYGAGLIAGVLERKLGERRSLLLGAVLATAGFLAGGFVTSLPALIVCVGVVTGSGSCLIYLCTLSTAMRRFPQRAAFVSSAMTCSASLMNLGTPLLYRYLSELYSWRGCLILTGGILLNTAIFSLLLTSPLLRCTPCKPPPPSPALRNHDDVAHDPVVTDKMAAHIQHPSELKTAKINHYGDSNTENAFQMAPLKSDSNSCSDAVHATDVTIDDVDAQEREKWMSPPPAKIDEKDENASALLSNKEEPDTGENHVADKRNDCCSKFKSNAAFLKDPLYICVTLCTVVSFSTSICFVFLVLDFATHKGWTVQDGIFLNFMFQLLGLLSRALVGVVSLHRRVRSIALLIVSGMVAGVGMCLTGQMSDFKLAALLYAVIGMGYGGLAGMFPAAVLEVTGSGPAYPIALGLVCTMGGTLNAVSGALGGLLVDELQSYSILSLVYGPLGLTVTLLLLYVYLCHSRSRPDPDSVS